MYRTLLIATLLLLPLSSFASTITTTAKGVQTGGQFSVEYEDFDDVPPEHKYVFDGLRKAELFERLVLPLNVALHLPKDIPVIIMNCDMVNAYFDILNNRVVFCNEYISEMIRKFESVYKTKEEVLHGIAGTVTFIFFHEVGHALVDNLGLPITGRQEDAVDQLALFTMIFDQNPRDIDLLMEAAVYWGLYGEWEAKVVAGEGKVRTDLAKIVFSDEHSMGLQRFYNTLCWAYGSNPVANAAILESGYLPTEKSKNCASEYALLADGWSRLLGKYLQGDNEETFLKSFNDTGKIVVTYDEGPGSPATSGLITLLKSNAVLESMTQPLSAAILMPKDIRVSVENCDTADVFFDKAESKIAICRKLITDAAGIFAKRYNGDMDKVTNGVIGTVLFHLYSQIGKAFVYNLELPITGLEDDAVDQLTVYLLTVNGQQESAALLLSAAEYLNAKSDEQVQSINEGGTVEGQFSGQRFYNILCWAYGSEQPGYANLVDDGLLPEARANRCEAEYELLSGSWARIIGPYFKKS